MLCGCCLFACFKRFIYLFYVKGRATEGESFYALEFEISRNLWSATEKKKRHKRHVQSWCYSSAGEGAVCDTGIPGALLLTQIPVYVPGRW